MAESSQTLIQLCKISFADITFCEKVGNGSFGIVYKARWQDQDVAVKEFDKNADTEAINREVKQLSRVKHPNIIALYGVSEMNLYCYLIMEYAEGGSLYNFLHGKIKPYYSASHAMSWARQCAEGVAYLHAMTPKALIHRDLKPPNLLLVNKGRSLKICDFGTVVDISTWMTNNKGSAAWMAPEVFKSDKYSEKCDVYSWGIILWEVLSREQPFEQKANTYTILWSVHKGRRPHLIQGCPKPIEMLMQSCWDAEPTKRPSMSRVVEIMTDLCKFFPSADVPLQYSHDIQNDQTTNAESIDADTIDNNKSGFENINSSEISEVTPTNSTQVGQFSNEFNHQLSNNSPKQSKSSPNSQMSPFAADPFRLTPSEASIKRNGEIRNAILQHKPTIEPIWIDVDSNSHNMHKMDFENFNDDAKSDGRERLTVTETIPDNVPGVAPLDVDDDDSSLHLMLDRELQPEPRLPNSRLSQEIYQEHTKLAKEFLRVDTELYYAIDKRKEILESLQPEERKQKEELLKKLNRKAELTELCNDLKQQLAQIHAAQQRQATMQSHLNNPSGQIIQDTGNANSSDTVDEEWILLPH